MLGTILSLIGGVFTRVLAGYISNKSLRHDIHTLVTTDASIEKIKSVQRDYDKVDWSARITRIFIVLPLVWVFIYLCWYVVTQNPELSYTIQTERLMSPLWAVFSPFPINKQGVLTINGVFVMERLWTATFFIIGFYLNKFGK